MSLYIGNKNIKILILVFLQNTNIYWKNYTSKKIRLNCYKKLFKRINSSMKKNYNTKIIICKRNFNLKIGFKLSSFINKWALNQALKWNWNIKIKVRNFKTWW